MRVPQAQVSALFDEHLPTSASEARMVARLQRFATAAGVFPVFVGVLVLLGWWLNVEQLKRVRADWPAMMGSTALMSIVSGASLVALIGASGRWRRRFGLCAALLVSLIAVLTLAEWMFDWNAHVDRLLVRTDVAHARFPGRSSPQTALTFFVLSAALVWLDREPAGGQRIRVSEVLCLVAMGMPTLAVLGYSYGISHLYGPPPLLPYTGVAVHTAFTMLALGIGIFAARPASGLMGVLTSKHAGGIAARRTLVAILALPLTAWAVISGVRAHWYPEPVGTALVVFVSVLDVLMLLVATSSQLERKEAALHRALREAAHWQHFFEDAHWGAAITTAEGILYFANHAFARMHGFSVDELIGRPIDELYSPEYRADHAARVPELLEQGALRFESEHMRKDGSRFPCLIDITAIKDASGRVLYRAGYMRDITEEKAAEQDRARLASLVESSDDGVIAATLDGTVLHWNTGAERIYGYSAAEMIGRSVSILVPPDCMAEYRGNLAAIARGERFRRVETTRLRKDGTPISVALTISPIVEASGRTTGMSAIVRDISRRKRAEEALARAREAELALSAGLEQLTRASIAMSNAVAELPQTSLTAVLDTIATQAQRLTTADYVALGVGTEHDKPFDTWVAVGMTDAQARAIGRIMRPAGVLGAVLREGAALRIRDIREHAAFTDFAAQHPQMGAFMAVPIRYLNRSVGNLYVARRAGGAEFSTQDERLTSLLAVRAGAAIETARLYMREALQHAWLEAMVDQMPEPVIVLDETGNIALQNRPAQALAHDAGRVDVSGKPLLHDIHYPSGGRVPIDALPHYRALRSGESVLGAEFVVGTAERSIPVVASATPVRIDSHVAGAVAIFQDVSSLKEFERQREEWISVVAHDLRQPISTIALSTQVLAQSIDFAMPVRARESVERIHKSVDKLTRMINDLLDASRLEAHRLTIERTPVDLRALLEEITGALPELAGNAVHMKFPPGAPWVSADSGRLEQIFRNLLSNAAKYGAPGAPIEVTVESRRNAYEITVCNHGAGITSEDMAHMFQRFGRAESTKRAGISGIGLGLYISQGLVEAHGGRIWVESTPGETTTFHVVLPALVTQAQAG